ncbi:MAG TPA: universal stress protein [Burkholderiales bacterium]|nr:universal stress protein [Burkholderiales bacterium]
MKILLAVDGSKASLDAVDCVIGHADWYSSPPDVELVTVHLPVPKLPGIGSVVGRAGVQRYYAEEGDERLAAAKKKLAAAGIKYQARVLVGQVAETLVKHARDKRCDMICIGTRGMTGAAAALMGSTASKVLHLATMPVLLVK